MAKPNTILWYSLAFCIALSIAIALAERYFIVPCLSALFKRECSLPIPCWLGFLGAWAPGAFAWEHLGPIPAILALVFLNGILIFLVSLELSVLNALATASFGGLGAASIVKLPKFPLPDWLAIAIAKHRIHRQMQQSLVVDRIQELPYVPNDRLELAIAQAVRRCGVNVLFAQPDTGKSTSCRAVLNEMLRKHEITGVVSLNGGKPFYHQGDTINDWIARTYHVPVPESVPLDELFEPFQSTGDPQKQAPIPVLLIDNFEDVVSANVLEEHRPLPKLMVKAISQSASGKRNFSVLILLNHFPLFDEMMKWNGHRKITGVVRDPLCPTDKSVEFIWDANELKIVMDGWIQRFPILQRQATSVMARIRSGSITTIPQLAVALLV
eukprot:m.230535 g.230535  ORF g.230535 m.230535 type:complete len:383 (+) comp12077_c0_seq1:55-1203(+)